MKKHFIVTVDGPAGAGKSTVSKLLAEALSCTYLDTGALYRGIAYQMARSGMTVVDPDRIRALCEETKLTLKMRQGMIRVFINGWDVTEDIRTPGISMLSSKISALPAVRKHLLSLQRKAARNRSVVAEGRDMGTVVFPNADVKFFLIASVEERARRRYEELKGKGFDTDAEVVKREIEQRDRQDIERDIAPLRAAGDAVIIDSTKETAADVVKRMIGHIRTRFPDACKSPSGCII